MAWSAISSTTSQYFSLPRGGSDDPPVADVSAGYIDIPKIDKINKNLGNTDLNITTFCPVELLFSARHHLH
jgi:hypothetical protein